MNSTFKKIADTFLLIKLVTLLQFGRRYWLIFLIVSIWPLIHGTLLLLGWRTEEFNNINVQNFLIGFPLYCLAIAMGIRIVAHEIEHRTLEVSYTVPGGARKIWLSKLFSAMLLLLASEVLLALITSLFFTSYSLLSLYNAFQGAAFFLVFSMFAGALTKNELTAALLAIAIGYLSLNISNNKYSALFNPLEVTDIVASELFTWSIQNNIGYFFVIVSISALSFSRAENRETLLAS